MHEVPAAWLRHAAAALGRDSAVVRGAMRAAGLASGVLADGSERIAARRHVDFLEHAAQLAGDDALGLNLGKSYDLRASGLAAYVAIASATLREAVLNAGRFAVLCDTGADYGLAEADGAASLRIECRDAYTRSHRQAVEFKVAFILAGCRAWVDPGFRPLEMRFAHPRAASRPAFLRYFGCPVGFGAETTEMLLDPAQLALPVRGADRHLLALLERLGEAMLAARGEGPSRLRARAERLVLERLPKGAPTAGEVAAALGLGERTFARRLGDEGVAFRSLVEEVRARAARSYLRDPELPLAQIAYLLGYSEQSAFTSAFRRWTGTSPGRYRAETTR